MFFHASEVVVGVSHTALFPVISDTVFVNCFGLEVPDFVIVTWRNEGA